MIRLYGCWCGSPYSDMAGYRWQVIVIWQAIVDYAGELARWLCRWLSCMGQYGCDMWPNQRVPCGTPDEANEGQVNNFVWTSLELNPWPVRAPMTSPNTLTTRATIVACYTYGSNTFCYDSWLVFWDKPRSTGATCQPEQPSKQPRVLDWKMKGGAVGGWTMRAHMASHMTKAEDQGVNA
jgi:hypothetical protein